MGAATGQVSAVVYLDKAAVTCGLWSPPSGHLTGHLTLRDAGARPPGIPGLGLDKARMQGIKL